MEEMLSRGWHELLARDSGPLHIRLILQPLVATILAIRAGRRDAQERWAVFFWTFVRDPAKRHFLIREAWEDVGKLFLVAIILDVIYQTIVLRWFYPVQTLIVAILLALVPYLIVRGLTNRMVSRLSQRTPSDDKGVSWHVPRDRCENDPGA
jgi:hypothetical protein